MGTAQLILYAIYRRKTPVPTSKEVDLEARVASTEQIEGVQVEMDGKLSNLQKMKSVPLKGSISRQSSLTKIVKSLSMPPLENSNWSLDYQLENEEA